MRQIHAHAPGLTTDFHVIHREKSIKIPCNLSTVLSSSQDQDDLQTVHDIVYLAFQEDESQSLPIFVRTALSYLSVCYLPPVSTTPYP